MLLGLTGVGLFAMVSHRYLEQAIFRQCLHVHLPGRFDGPTHSLHQFILDESVQVQSWQLNWALCLCFSKQTPQWVFADEVDAGTFAALKRLVKITNG
jgi:hypothetical protein|tara:strand:+ start:478 stop:771 length:294 start_codon:yes stop_codon:yes gene_type:complete